jgi:hypothetical protein
MFRQPQRHLALADGCDNPLLRSVSAEQLERPSHATFRRLAAGQSDDLLPLPRREHGRGAAPRCVVQGPLDPFRTKPLADAADHPVRAANVLDNLLVGEPFVGLQQHQRPSNHAHRSRA